MKSYAAEVTTGTDPKYYGNALRFRTHEEAHAYVLDLALRWTLVRETRVVESEDEPTHEIVGGSLRRISA